ncbi:MAG: hypothetical protein SH856_02625 [Flavobacteriales bacterium]|nr:hypothetical protein [Flavobacteriales bacterium]
MKTIRQLTLICSSLFVIQLTQAQVEIAQQVISPFNMLAQDTQGNYYSICVGQPNYTTETGPYRLINQGFEQADKQFCPGDFNHDGIVNSGDLLLMLALYGCISGNCDDINQDGVFNVFDLLLFMALVGTMCNY